MLVVVVAAIAFVLFVLSRLAALQRQLDDAAAKLEFLQRLVEASSRPLAAPPVRHTAEAPAAVPTPSPTPPTTAPQVRPPVAPSLPAAVSAVQSHPDIEQQIGSRWMLIVGVVVLVLGVAFFVKYAFDNHWVNERTRVGIGTAAGIAAWIGGLRFTRAGYVLYGRILAGGGLAIVYVAAYAAAALYGLVPAAFAFGWMAIASGATALTADRQRSVGLAATAIVLAYAAPFLVGGRTDHHIVLFVFDGLLVAASLALVRRHGWPVLGATSFALTWMSFGLWSEERYVPRWYAETEMYLTAVTAAFVAMRRMYGSGGAGGPALAALFLSLAVPLYHLASIAVLFPHSLSLLVYFIVFTTAAIGLSRRSSTLRLAVWAAIAVPFFSWASNHVLSSWYAATLITAAAIYVLHLAAQLRAVPRSDGPIADAELVLFHANALGLFGFTYLAVSSHSGSAGRLAFVLAAWHGLFALAVRRRLAPLFVHAIALAFAFIAIGIALELSGPWLTVAWAAEGFAATWIGLRVSHPRLRLGGAVLIVLAVIRLVALEFGVTLVTFTPILNSRTLTGLFIVALMYGVAVLDARTKSDAPFDTPTAWIVAANVLTVGLITADITSYWRLSEAGLRANFARELSISIAWGVYAMVLIALGFRRQSAALRYLALGLFGITVAKMFLVDLLQLGGIYRITGFVVLGIVLLLASFLYQRRRAREQDYAGG